MRFHYTQKTGAGGRDFAFLVKISIQILAEHCRVHELQTAAEQRFNKVINQIGICRSQCGEHFSKDAAVRLDASNRFPNFFHHLITAFATAQTRPVILQSGGDTSSFRKRFSKPFGIDHLRCVCGKTFFAPVRGRAVWLIDPETINFAFLHPESGGIGNEGLIMRITVIGSVSPDSIVFRKEHPEGGTTGISEHIRSAAVRYNIQPYFYSIAVCGPDKVPQLLNRRSHIGMQPGEPAGIVRAGPLLHRHDIQHREAHLPEPGKQSFGISFQQATGPDGIIFVNNGFFHPVRAVLRSHQPLCQKKISHF